MPDAPSLEAPLVPIPPTNRRADLVAASVLLAIVLIAHGGSLFDGLFFDDYWHRATLRDYGWDWNGLIESATFDLPGRLAHLWWLEQPLQWRYARPVAMFFMKIEYVLGRGNPIAIHAFGLLWHWLCALLVYRIGRWAIPTRRETSRANEEKPAAGGWFAAFWPLLAATLFILHPQSVFGVSWTASRNALVSAFFFLLAIQIYAGGSLIGRRALDGFDWKRVLAATVLWILALFSRETAMIFPLLVPLLDFGFGGWRSVRQRFPIYGILGGLLCGYLYWRLLVFPVTGAPSIYFTVPHGIEYVVWAASKLLHMVFAHIVHTPMFLGIATYSGLSGGRMIEHGAMLAVVGLVLVLYALGSRGVRGRWVWLAWTVLAFVPVIPVFVMPHFSYLPAAATAIMIPLMLRRLRGGWRAAAVVFVVLYAAWPLAIYRFAWRGVVRSEQLVYADMSSQAVPLPRRAGADVPKLFLLNLPACGIYATVAMREAWERDDVEGYVLTFAPHPLMMTQSSTIERLSDHEFAVSTPAPGYFSGLSGQMLRQGMRPNSALEAGTIVPGECFDAEVLEADQRGITKLKFTFRKPLDSPEYLFYVCTPERPARRINFSTAVGDDRAKSERWQSDHAAMLREREIYFWIIETARRLVRSDLYLTGD